MITLIATQVMTRLHDAQIEDAVILQDLGHNNMKRCHSFLVSLDACGPTAISLILAEGGGLNYKANKWNKNLNLRLERTSRFQ